MLYGLQTHFNAPIPSEDLAQIKTLGFDLCRMDAQTCFIHVMKDMVKQIQDAGMKPLIIVGDFNTLRAVPAGLNVEWRNEPDIALGRPVIPANVYADEFWQAAEIADDIGVKLWGPVISNLNKRGFDYLHALGELPPNVGVSVHRYGDGTYKTPHKLSWMPWGKFHSREEELEELKSLIGERPFGVSEFGYPTADMSEAEQASNISKEWDLYKREGATFSVLYQIYDGPVPTHDHSFGIKRSDGSLKPSAFTIPKTTNPDPPSEGEDMPQATEGIRKENLIAVGTKFVARYPSNADTVLSIQPGGAWDVRPAGTSGPWEAADYKDNALVYDVEGHTYFVPVR